MSIMERCANPKSQLEIDEWILDYLVFMAIKYVLEDYKSSESPGGNANARGKAGLPLQLVDCKQPQSQLKPVQSGSFLEQLS